MNADALDGMEAMHRVVRGEANIAHLANAWGVQEERLKFYRDAVKSHIREAIEKNYDVSSAYFSKDIFDALVDAFYVSYPADHYELNRCVRHYSEFIERMYHENRFGIPAWLCDMVQLEWAEWEAYSSRDNPIQPPSGVGCVLNPTLDVFAFTYPVGTWVRQWRSDDRSWLQSDLAPEDETVFVFRDPRECVAYSMVASPRMLFVFKMLHDGMSPVEAATAAGFSVETVDEMLTSAVDDGWVVLD